MSLCCCCGLVSSRNVGSFPTFLLDGQVIYEQRGPVGIVHPVCVCLVCKNYVLFDKREQLTC